jgi:uncharacterized protein (TIGR02594 family)
LAEKFYKGHNILTPYEVALKDLSVTEVSGTMANPRIVEMFSDAGHPTIKNDEVAWCAAATGSWLKRGGYEPSGSLLARSYLNWGAAVSMQNIVQNDVIVFKRGEPWQGHVGLVETVKDGWITVISGNSLNAVRRTQHKISDPAILGVRRGSPIKQPAAKPSTMGPLAAVAAIAAIVAAYFKFRN